MRSMVWLVLLSALASDTIYASPRSDYLLHCGGCHLESGAGTPPEVPDLTQNLDWLASAPEGRSYLTRVPGASQVPISDERLAGVFNWMFRVYYPDSEITPYTASEVSRTRSLPLYDPLKERARLVSSLPAKD